MGTKATRKNSGRTASAKDRRKPAGKPAATRGSAKPARSTKTPAAGQKRFTASLAEAPIPAVNSKPASSGLSRKEIGQFRDMLLQKRSELVGDVTTMRNEALSKNRQDAAGDLSNMPIHMADLGTDNYEQEFTLGLIESERAILGEIDDALARIQGGRFGVCAATGRPIGKARLRATPWAKHCYEYVLAQEKGHGRGP